MIEPIESCQSRQSNRSIDRLRNRSEFSLTRPETIWKVPTRIGRNYLLNWMVRSWCRNRRPIMLSSKILFYKTRTLFQDNFWPDNSFQVLILQWVFRFVNPISNHPWSIGILKLALSFLFFIWGRPRYRPSMGSERGSEVNPKISIVFKIW